MVRHLAFRGWQGRRALGSGHAARTIPCAAPGSAASGGRSMDDSAGRVAPAAARWMLLLLILAHVLSVGDRMLLSVATGPIRQELALSDREIALVNGLLFVVFHLAAGLFVARLIDRGNR